MSYGVHDLFCDRGVLHAHVIFVAQANVEDYPRFINGKQTPLKFPASFEQADPHRNLELKDHRRTDLPGVPLLISFNAGVTFRENETVVLGYRARAGGYVYQVLLSEPGLQHVLVPAFPACWGLIPVVPQEPPTDIFAIELSWA